MRLLLLALAAAAGWSAEIRAEPVDLELVLAVDSSASVDYIEFNLQLEGLAYAFRDPDLIAAIGNGRHGAVAVVLMEWASTGRNEIVLPWTRIRDAADAAAFADRIDRSPRQIQTGATSISSAIRFANALFDDNGYEGTRRTIDVSGDGYNNQGEALSSARAEVIASGTTINALAIENQVLGLGDYFEDQLIGGLGAFVIRADSYRDYLGKIRRKLLREIQAPPMS
ncbi:MAG: DUF1194 domain-containing protein [Thalassobaculum sp.]|uniref:DUF1194 domain-containing protein n=1 Tax=Thalassobaculum sp. TaxID=2022740 RepID=UPI0032EA9703